MYINNVVTLGNPLLHDVLPDLIQMCSFRALCERNILCFSGSVVKIELKHLQNAVTEETLSL